MLTLLHISILAILYGLAMGVWAILFQGNNTIDNEKVRSHILLVVLFGSYTKMTQVDDPKSDYFSDYDILVVLNLETAVGSQKSVQALDAPGKFEKALITNKVTTRFSNPPITSISYTAFLRPTAVSRLNESTLVDEYKIWYIVKDVPAYKPVRRSCVPYGEKGNIAAFI